MIHAENARSGASKIRAVTYTLTLEATADLMRDVAAAGEGFLAEGRQS